MHNVLTEYLRSAARVGPRTHVILTLHKGPPQITTLCGNLSVCRRPNNILYRRNDGFANKHTKQCSSWTQKFDTTTRKMWSNDHAAEINIHWPYPSSLSWQQHHEVDNLRKTPWSASWYKLLWPNHAANVAKSFESKLSLLRRTRFLTRKQLEDLYTKVILHPSVTYGLTVWGSCNKTHINNLEELRARAGRIVCGLHWDTSAEDVLMRTGWDSLETMYKLRLTEFVFKCIKGYTVTECKDLFLQRNSGRKRNENIILPKPEANFIRNSIRYGGAIASNCLTNKETRAKTLKEF